MQLFLTTLKSWSDEVVIFSGFKTSFWPAITIADIFMLLLCAVKRLVSWSLTGFTAVIKYRERRKRSGVWMQIHLNFARTVSSIHYNATYSTFETLSTFQFIATWKVFYKLIEKLLIAIEYLLTTPPRYNVCSPFSPCQIPIRRYEPTFQPNLRLCLRCTIPREATRL